MECISKDVALGDDAHVSEDSVDIYDDLDLQAVSSSEKSPPASSRLQASMDLYEDIVREEQQGRESSYIDLKSRFQAAQNQIKELRRRLEQLELQNTGLNTENHLLKKNISALLRTARQEVMRKDAEIQRLNQSSGKGHHHHHHHHSQMHDQNPSCHSFTSSMSKPPTSSLPAPSPTLCSSPQTSSSRDDRLPKVHLEAARKESGKTSGSCTETRPSSHKGSSVRDVQKELSVSNSVSSSTWHHGSDKHKSKHREEKCQKSFDSADRKHRTGLDSSYTIEKVRSHKLDRERRHDSRTCKSRDYQNVDGHRRSESGKTPPVKNLNVVGSSDDSKGRTHEKKHRSGHSYSDDRSRHSRKIKTSDEKSSLEMELKRSDSKDRKRSSVNPHTECSSASSKEKQRSRHSGDYQRKGDKQREDEKPKSHKRNTASETKREGDKQPSGEAHNNKPDANNKERQGKKHVQISVKELLEDKRENRKLCFMETLNLTLSPNKKLLPNSSRNDGLTALQPVLERGPGGDMFVIHQIDSSESQACLEKLPTDSVEAPISETLTKRDVQERDTSPEDTAVQATCLLSHDSAMDGMASCVTPKTQENSSLVEKDSPDSQLDVLKQVDATDHATDVCGSGKDRSPLQKTESGNINEQCIAVTQHADSRLAQDSGCPNKVMEYAGTSKNVSTPEDVIHTHPESGQTSPITRHQDAQIDVHPPASSGPANDKDTCYQDDLQDANAVSSTISLESVPQEGLSLPEAIYVLTNKDDGGSSCLTTDQVSSLGCIGVSNVSSTTEEMSPPDQYCELTVTPKKNLCEKSLEKNVEPSCSMPLLHDEDSMMRTLSNLKRIPDAISPLRSPIHMKKRSHLLVHGKPGHVKSLQKEFSSTACDANSKKQDLNKENKYPGSPSKHAKQDLADKLPEMPSNLSDTEPEEGEILSESDDASSGSPLHATKRVKSAGAVRSKANPKSLLEKRKCEERTAAESASSPGSKSRFKTVRPVSTKASFTTVEEVMETFKMVRMEIRKKYMKLHRTFPKRSFCGVMENFRESFVQFVEGAHFSQICCRATELKSKLKVLIISMFNKVADNGIVKRIFDQQAADLKQKLWDFVDVQLDYLLKDIYATLKNLCRAVRTFPEKKRSCVTESVPGQKDSKGLLRALDPMKPCVASYKTGLGSRGKGIRITHTGKQKNVGTCPQNDAPADPGVDGLSPKKPSVSDKTPMALVVKSQSTSSLDKTDFELLTEQQASSLTFNLVRDSQMGEIFKCLLQGSDLLEPSGESTSWSLSTPKKNGETLISITTPTKFDSPTKFLSPTKFDTPSKLIATWSSISPRNMFPQAKDHVTTNPVLFDESCLLEVPSENQATLQSNFLSQRNYSILAEDLEVSLTIPSPLKSDSHLSFLQPSGVHTISTPDSVISAHISEDALLDGEDATEQDIHLALDTDNSSSGSSSGVPSQAVANAFVLKPELPMQALVMEKSNDHFIVKIRQGSTQTLDVDETLSPTRTEEDTADKSQKQASPCNEIYKDRVTGIHTTSGGIAPTKDDKEPPHTSAASKHATDETQKVVASPRAPSEQIHSKDKSLTTAEEDVRRDPEKDNKDVEKRKKRKRHQEHSKAKRPREDQEDQIGNESLPPSPNSFSAMNVVKRKGAVVMAWTRDEDRAILIDLKTKGASRETFADLSDKLKKPSEQIAQRFYQLMKLFKKQGKMDV
ncbi:CASP8-associated protein 2 [Dunckerocampus dactyliophorus]|uniref:CASP8-associated protein 2 n=1 Tax=Dunckerocampus dactyliophorus TaxID=161453 RepID=UPI00240515FC|nr:CASP8-associated protein 2 [Dunckerocampus dactyliophorus]